MTDEDVFAFRTAALAVVAADEANEVAGDFDSNEVLLKKLWSSLTPEQFERFAQVVEMAASADHRCPK